VAGHLKIFFAFPISIKKGKKEFLKGEDNDFLHRGIAQTRSTKQPS
jgi:hypothetical protein